MKELNKGELAFAAAVLEGVGSGEAYTAHIARPGSNPANAAAAAYRVMKRPHVANWLAARRADAMASVGLASVDVFAEAIETLRVSMREGLRLVRDFNGNLVPHSLPAAVAAAAQLAKIHLADHSTGKQLAYLSTLSSLDGKSFMTVEHLRALADQISCPASLPVTALPLLSGSDKDERGEPDGKQ